MSKAIKFVLLFIGLAVVAAILFPVVVDFWGRRGQPEKQENILNRSFAKVQLQNGRILLLASRNYHLMRAMEEEDFKFFEKPRLLSVGSQFRANDSHWGATYTIKEIKPEGVVIHFDASGRNPSSVRRSNGDVLLTWK